MSNWIDPAYGVECPSCGQPVGQRCIFTMRGRAKRMNPPIVHRSREEAARTEEVVV